jgi:Gnt-I system high-affinity gluconate transporter
LMVATVLQHFIASQSFSGRILSFFAEPAVVMLISLAVATYTLGLQQGTSIKDVMTSFSEAVKDIAGILLIIGSSGALKQVLTDSGVSQQIAAGLNQVNIPPILLAWLIAAIIRICVGSATVAGLTTAGLLAPLILQSHVNPNLMVLSIGAGSLACSHVNDSGFWMFK